MANKYAYNKEVDEAKTARAMAKSLKISPKHSVEICSAIRGMEVGKAKACLEDVIDMKKSVPDWSQLSQTACNSLWDIREHHTARL